LFIELFIPISSVCSFAPTYGPLNFFVKFFPSMVDCSYSPHHVPTSPLSCGVNTVTHRCCRNFSSINTSLVVFRKRVVSSSFFPVYSGSASFSACRFSVVVDLTPPASPVSLLGRYCPFRWEKNSCMLFYVGRCFLCCPY